MNGSLFTLSGAPVKEAVQRTWIEIGAVDLFGRAAQLAYYFFLGLFPFLICVVASLSLFGSADRGRALLLRFFSDALPPSASLLISSTFTEIIRSGGPLKMSLGILAALWAASMGMSAVMDTLNAAYDVKETRSFLKRYALAVGLTTVIALLFVVSIIIVIFGDRIVAAWSTESLMAPVWSFFQWPLVIILILLAFAITYYVAPDIRDRHWHWITPGAILGLLLWLAVSIGFRVYLHFFSSYNAMYGSLGAVIVLLLWFYFSGISLLSGAALNGVLEKLAAAQERQGPTGAAKQQAAHGSAK